MKKNHSNGQSARRTRLSPEQKQTLREQRYSLLQKWGEGMDAPSIDWEYLFNVHLELYQLEHNHPWLKKAVA